MENSVSSDLIRGHINTIILTALFEGDKYGYEICKDIEIKSHGKYILKQPTLYSALKRLEEQGYVEAYWGAVSNGGRRRYYTLTELGKSVSKQNQIEWEFSRSVIDNLISKNDFNFDNNEQLPSLDMNILKKSTSRINTGKSFNGTDENDDNNIKYETSEFELKDDNFSSSKNSDDEGLLAEINSDDNKNFSEDSILLSTDNMNNKIIKEEIKKSSNDVYDYLKEENAYERDYKQILKKLLPKKKVQEIIPEHQIIKPQVVNENLEKTEEFFYEKEENLDNFNKSIETEKFSNKDSNLLPHRQKSNEFSDIYEKAQLDGLKINKFETIKKPSNKKVYFLLKNKILLNTVFFLFFLMFVETALIFAFTNKITLWTISIYLGILACITILPVIALIVYVLDPKKKSNADYSFKNQFGNAIIIFFVFVLIILGCSLIFEIPLIVPKEFYSKILIPVIYSSNILIYPIIYSLFIKSSKYFI